MNHVESSQPAFQGLHPLTSSGFPSSALAWAQYEPESQAGRSSLLSIHVCSSVSTLVWTSLWLLSTSSFYSSFKGQNKPSATLPFHKQAAVSFEFRSPGVCIPFLLLIGWRIWSNSLTLSLPGITVAPEEALDQNQQELGRDLPLFQGLIQIPEPGPHE